MILKRLVMRDSKHTKALKEFAAHLGGKIELHENKFIKPEDDRVLL